jgi:predicted nucleic acid-binding protein
LETSGNVLFDTNIYLRVLRSEDYARGHLERFRRLAPRTYLCSVVAAELYAGARTLGGMRLVDGLLAPYVRIGRVTFPNHNDWLDMGKVAAEIGIADAGSRVRATALENDILIALSAKRVGAVVVTENEKDFSLIRKHVSFAFAVMRSANPR